MLTWKFVPDTDHSTSQVPHDKHRNSDHAMLFSTKSHKVSRKHCLQSVDSTNDSQDLDQVRRKSAEQHTSNHQRLPGNNWPMWAVYTNDAHQSMAVLENLALAAAAIATFYRACSEPPGAVAARGLVCSVDSEVDMSHAIGLEVMEQWKLARGLDG